MFWTPVVLTGIWAYLVYSVTTDTQSKAIRNSFIAAYVKYLSQKVGLAAERSAWTRIVAALGGGRLAVMAKDAKFIGTYALAGLFGGFVGYETSKFLFNKGEDLGILSEGATEDYIEQHRSLDTAWSNIYSPRAIVRNIDTIGNALLTPLFLKTDFGKVSAERQEIVMSKPAAIRTPAPIIGPSYRMEFYGRVF